MHQDRQSTRKITSALTGGCASFTDRLGNDRLDGRIPVSVRQARIFSGVGSDNAASFDRTTSPAADRRQPCSAGAGAGHAPASIIDMSRSDQVARHDRTVRRQISAQLFRLIPFIGKMSAEARRGEYRWRFFRQRPGGRRH